MKTPRYSHTTTPLTDELFAKLADAHAEKIKQDKLRNNPPPFPTQPHPRPL